MQVQYGIDRDRSIIDFYHQHNLDYHLGLNNFLQTDSERQGVWFDEYYTTYLRQPLHPVPDRINTLELELNLPQLTFAQLKQKYSQFWGADNNYFIGGESQAKATLKLFLAERISRLPLEGITSLVNTAGCYIPPIASLNIRYYIRSQYLPAY